jgi:hypothetical protein
LNGGDIGRVDQQQMRILYLNYGHGDQIYSTPILPG